MDTEFVDDPEASLTSVDFTFYSIDEIRKLSVKQITHEVAFDKFTLQGIVGGLHDPELGPSKEEDICRHCNLNYWNCPGHMSHIEFVKPVYNPLLFDRFLKLLKSFCYNCHTIPEGQALMTMLIALGYETDNEEQKGHADVELLRSRHPDEIRNRALALLSTQLRGLCPACNSKCVIVTHSKREQILVKTATRGAKQPRKSKKNDSEDEEPVRPWTREVVVDDFGDEVVQDDVEEERGHQVKRRKESGRGQKHQTSQDTENQDVSLDTMFTKSEKGILPEEFREHFRRLWENEKHKLSIVLPFLGQLKQFSHPTDAFFMEAVPVTPPFCRPSGESLAGGLTFVNSETANLVRVVRQSRVLRTVCGAKSGPDGEEFTDDRRRGTILHASISLQRAVNACFDMTLDSYMVERQPGLRQRLEKKEGLFRMHMMGKRVDYACRSVISPDPNLAVDEIGIPEVFARGLTFPEPVSPWNVERMRVMVERGPMSYPGATTITLENGSQLLIPKHDAKKRMALAKQLCHATQGSKTRVVHRHCLPGDLFIMNRQPTLHQPSMQAHRARILSAPGAKTLRMHYSNCKAYNADFDGDEMNGHFIQTYEAKAEAKYIAAVPFQYLVPKDGTPLAGLIQDHVISGVKLTLRDRFFSRDDYYDLVYNGLQAANIGRIRTLPPTIIWPKKLWTGKQVISTILINLTPKNKACINISCPGRKSKAELWSGSTDPLSLSLSDVDLEVRNGVLMSGMLDKSHIGASSHGLVHCFYEAYGPQAACDLLTAITRVVNKFLVYVSFTLGLKDILLSSEADTSRSDKFHRIQALGPVAFCAAFNLSEEEMTPDKMDRLYQRAQFDRSGEYQKQLEELDRQLKSRVKTAQDAVCDESIPNGLYVRFPHNNLQFMVQSGAKGGMVNAQQMSVGLGQIELEGKRVPLMLSGRTLPSFRPYDTSPRAGGLCTYRFLSGMPPQELFFHSMAGRDGLVDTAVKTSRSGYLQRSLIKHLEDISVQYDNTVRDSSGCVVQFQYGDDGVDIKQSSLIRENGFLFMANNQKLFQPMVESVPSSLRRATLNKSIKKTISDTFCNNQQILTNPRLLPVSSPTLTEKSLRRLVGGKLVLSTVQPGEMVGLLAAQSIGEPSTQMTLNTFHLAGRAEMNVTLGIPRLREIVMMSSGKISTPCMAVPVLPTATAHRRVSNVLIKRFNKLYLKDVLLMPIECHLNSVSSEYKLTFNFKRHREYKELTKVTPEGLLHYMEKNFFKTLGKTIQQSILGQINDNILQASKQKRVTIKAKDDDKDEDDIEDNAKEDAEWNEEDGTEANRQRDADEESDDLAGEDEEMREMGIHSDNDRSDDEEEDGEKSGEDPEAGSADEMGEELPTKKVKRSKRKEPAPVDPKRENNVRRLNPSFIKYSYDTESARWCQLTISLQEHGDVRLDLKSIVMGLIEGAVVHSVKGLEKAIIDKENKEQWIMRTEGINFEIILGEAETFDLNRIYTNNTTVMMEKYGIEAARACICKEIKEVFGHYGIHVNPRHLSLLSDYMTQPGEYRAFTRKCLSSHPSILQKVTFETSTVVLKEAIINSSFDDLSSPSSSIVLGQLARKCGTNIFNLLSTSVPQQC